jgi:hypothetical protein
MAHQADQQIGVAQLLLVDAARVGIARARSSPSDRLEAVQSIDRPVDRLAICGRILAGGAEKDPVDHRPPIAARNRPTLAPAPICHPVVDLSEVLRGVEARSNPRARQPRSDVRGHRCCAASGFQTWTKFLESAKISPAPDARKKRGARSHRRTKRTQKSVWH